ncbi:MAG: hypothetical protein ACE5JX_15080 [Acidobacteriota bacterium]
MSRKQLLASVTLALLLATAGCGKKTVRLDIPEGYKEAKTASLQDLLDLVNERYAKAETLTVSRFRVEFTGGSLEKGYLEKYPRAKGHLVAKRPDSIFINILNPLTSSTVVTMAASEGHFQIWAPGENKYLTGSTNLRNEEQKPLYSVRPDHLLNAILVEPIPTEDPAYRYALEEDQDSHVKYYVITLFQLEENSHAACLARKLWIERGGLKLVRQQYYRCGQPISDIRYSEPITLDQQLISTQVSVERIPEAYRIRLELRRDTIALNRRLRESAFRVPQPPGAEWVVLADKSP